MVTLMKTAALAIGLASLTFAAPAFAAVKKSPSAPPPPIEGTAVPIDGNTLMVEGRTVRLFGIDVFEMRDPHGAAARGVLDDLVRGSKVVCAFREKGRHIGAVAVCKIDMTDIAQAMLKSGYATVNRLDTADTDFAALYDAAELEARRDGAGIWIPPAPRQPGAWSAAWFADQLWDLPNGALLLLIGLAWGGRNAARRYDIPTHLRGLYARLRDWAAGIRIIPPAA